MVDFYKRLWAEAARLGFDWIGVNPARPGRRLAAYLDWIESGMHGEMGYMARPDRVSRRRDLNVVLPGVQSIISVAVNYYSGALPPEIAQDPARGRISNYAWGVDYHEVMTPRLEELADWLEIVSGEKVRSRVYVDTGAVLERDHAETAVLGFTGKNTMIIHPRRGSYIFLGEILTTLPTPTSDLPAENSQPPSCGSCRRCLDACPTGAFPKPYVLDARRCISYLTIELKGWIPRELRPFMANWVYGCDICQEVCPFNRFAGTNLRPSSFKIPQSQFDYAAPSLLDLLVLEEPEFSRRFAHSPIKRIKRHRLVRNACVAAGNWGSRTAVPALISLLTDTNELVRGHAAWALGQIGGNKAIKAVAEAFELEPDSDVRREMFEVLR